jgi:UDP-N-acetylglucosamine 2-epimerase (hydrolysing)
MSSGEPGAEAPAARHVCFVTGTRADFGKLKPLIHSAASVPGVRVTVIATGMHLLERYGSTVIEVRRLEPEVTVAELVNQDDGDTLDRILARTIDGLARLFDVDRPDLLVVHGDRVEALAAASVGALRNVAVAHVEGGELSGTIDGILRHAISKLSHLHLVANDDAARRVVQLGEHPDTVRVIGSPDIDVMLSDSLPSLESVLSDYEIPFCEFAVVILHGVTHQPVDDVRSMARSMVDALVGSELRAVVIYPNNDAGSSAILEEYDRLSDAARFRVFPSVRFEAFLTLLHHSRMLIGNSSAGIREAPIYGIPSVNIGDRQRDRHHHPTIISCGTSTAEIRSAIDAACTADRAEPNLHFGRGDSAARFADLLRGGAVWSLGSDKIFRDLPAEDRPGAVPSREERS